MNKIAKMTGFMLLAVSMLSLSTVSGAFASSNIKAGQAISNDGFILSNDGRFALVMQGDGNLVLYPTPASRGNSLWDSGTRGKELVWYDQFSGLTLKRKAEVLRLNSYGQLMITDYANYVTFWIAPTQAWMDNYYKPPMIYPTGLSGDTLFMQDDGNCVLYDTIHGGGTWKPVWATDTGGH